MARHVRVVDAWERAVEIAHNYAFQTGWRYTVRRVPNTAAFEIRRTRERVRHRRCNPARERELGRHAT